MIPLNTILHNDSVEELESQICKYTGAKYCLAVTNATAGLFMSLLPIIGTEILIPSYGFPAVWKLCELLSFKPIPIQMDYDSMSMDMDDARSKLTPNTFAMINVESNGVLGNLDEMQTFAKEHGLFFIEDSASALVQNYNGINAGTFGDIGVYSFSDTKVLNSGEGGAVVTNDLAIYDFLKNMRYSSDYSKLYPLSMNFNLSVYLAERLLTQFKDIDLVARDRERVHDSYKRHGLNIFEDESVSNRYQYIMYKTPSANAVSEKLTKLHIGHRYQHYAVIGDMEIANRIQSETIDLPTFYQIEDRQIETICSVIRMVEHGNI